MSSNSSSRFPALVNAERRAVLSPLRRLPARQQEAIVLRFYVDLPELEAARSMGISLGTVKSAPSRALAALGRLVQEAP